MKHEISVYVRVSETDMFGHVNNTSHFLYFEEARTKFFQEIYPSRDSTVSFILASITCDYLKQAYYGEALKVLTSVSEIGIKSFHMTQTLAKGDQVIAEATATAVCFDYEEQRTVPLPESVKSNLREKMITNTID